MPILGFWFPEQNETKVREKFNITNNDLHYSQFKNNVIIKGVYDDHDSNENNGGKFNPLKESAKQLYLDFLNEPQDSHLRKQDGIYQSFYADEYKKILIVMTDTRYNSDPFTGDNLGERQWAWLEQQFVTEGELIIMTSGVQVMHDDRHGPETWFRESKDRLFDLIRKYHKPIIFLSGDVHYSEIMKHPCPQNIGQNIYEFTSSGLTFANHDHIPFVEILFKFLFPQTFSSPNDHYYKRNFGLLKIQTDASNSPKKILYETHSSDNSEVVLSRSIDIAELQQQYFDQSTCVLDAHPNVRFWNNVRMRVQEYGISIAVLVLVLLVVATLFIKYMLAYCWEMRRLYHKIRKANKKNE